MAELACRERGPKGGRTLVFLHGFMGGARDWNPFIHSLFPAFRCLAVDLPGHGESVSLTSEAYSMSGAIASLRETLSNRRAQQPILIGYSMGGRLALAYGCAFACDVSGLLLESASPGIEDIKQRQERLNIDRLRAQDILLDYDRFLAAWHKMPLFSSLSRHPDLIEGLVRQRRQLDPRELSLSVEGMSIGSYEPYWECLERLEFPVQAVCGGDDSKFVPMGKRIAASAPNGMYRCVEGVGHNVHLEAGEQYGKILEGFVSQFGSIEE